MLDRFLRYQFGDHFVSVVLYDPNFWVLAVVGFFNLAVGSIGVFIVWRRIKSRYPDSTFEDLMASESIFSTSKRYPFGEPWVVKQLEDLKGINFLIALYTMAGLVVFASISSVLTNGV